MDVFIADLHEDGAGLCEQVARDGQPIPQISEVAVYAIAPGVAKGLDLLWFAGDVAGVSILYITAGG